MINAARLGLVLLLSTALAAPASAQTSVDRILNRIRTGNTLPPSQAQAQAAQPNGPITVAPMPVTLKKSYGNQKAFQIFKDRIAVAGYNLGGFRTGKTTGRASGGLLNTNPGAASTVEIVAYGIDQVLLTRVANAAYIDLQAQLKEAGFIVVPYAEIGAAAGADKLKLGGQPFEAGMAADRGNIRALVVGPTETGVRENYPAIKREFGAFGAPELSMALNAMVVMPNLVFDFVRLRSSRSWGYTASASAELQFGIHNASSIRVNASTRKQFVEGDIVYGLDGDAVSDEPFGTVSETVTTDNSGEQALGQSLGVGVQARSTESIAAQIDRTKYEALALAAAKGWNAAFVAQVRAATGR